MGQNLIAMLKAAGQFLASDNYRMNAGLAALALSWAIGAMAECQQSSNQAYYEYRTAVETSPSRQVEADAVSSSESPSYSMPRSDHEPADEDRPNG